MCCDGFCQSEQWITVLYSVFNFPNILTCSSSGVLRLLPLPLLVPFPRTYLCLLPPSLPSLLSLPSSSHPHLCIHRWSRVRTLLTQSTSCTTAPRPHLAASPTLARSSSVLTLNQVATWWCCVPSNRMRKEISSSAFSQRRWPVQRTATCRASLTRKYGSKA